MIRQRAANLIWQRAFWAAVLDCLTSIHRLPRPEAEGRVARFKARLTDVSPELQKGVEQFVYHDEPFDLACELAENAIPLEKFLEQYNTILRRHELVPIARKRDQQRQPG